MAKNRKSKQQVREEIRTKKQERQVIIWAIGITIALLILTYFIYQIRL